ncbi:Transcriptional corepressor SEUSS [Dendrobium catenatum]|uniref:Transcriptional corepressor SEUSS n=1 Tax=Dendrobium catenatum TaxID=906689 RepID=A0A2I0WPA8_9ASPA|nr:Transcriptional corepressor SEUSS [Dendrobium catenatum]
MPRTCGDRFSRSLDLGLHVLPAMYKFHLPLSRMLRSCRRSPRGEAKLRERGIKIASVGNLVLQDLNSNFMLQTHFFWYQEGPPSSAGLALEGYLKRSHSLASSPSPLVPPLRVAGGGGPSPSSSASCIFFLGDGQSSAPASSISGAILSGLGPGTSADLNHRVLNSAANSSGPSMGASSLVTDANSSLSGGPQLQRSSSINNESYTHLPASPLSFSSNNISCSSVMDGSSIVQHSPQQEHMVKQGNSSNLSQSIMHESGMLPAEKRPRLDMRQGDAYHQQVIQQMLQRQQSPQIQAMIHQQRLAQAAQQQQQQQILQSLPQLQRMQVHQQTQQPRPNPLQLVSPARRPSESGLCAWRLMQYMYHQSHRPPDNSITYWRKFVVEYFAPKAKKRWCLSLYNGVGSHPLGTFPQASMLAQDAWQCGICGSKSGKGFEATYEVLPRLNQIKFDHGVIDELLYLEMPREGRLPSGMMVLEYEKAVQESVYEQIRVVREGQLRIIFTPDLKILCWEFCARRHEELFPRRMMANQVNQLLHVAQKYQAAVNESGTSGLSVQDLQASCNMFVAAGWQLARNLELQSLNDLGFSKRYVRCLQISEVVNSMKDLINFSQAQKMGPIDSLKNFSHAASKLQSQNMNEAEQIAAAQNLPIDQNKDKLISGRPGFGNHSGNTHPTTRFLNNTSQATMPLNSYQYLSRNSANLDQNHLRSDASFALLNQAPTVPFQGNGASSAPGQSFHNPQQQALPTNLCQINKNQTSSQANQHLQQHMIQQLLQEMMNKGTPQPALNTPVVNGNVTADVVGCSGPVTATKITGPGRIGTEISTDETSTDVKGMIPTTSDTSKPPSKSSNSCISNNNYTAKLDALENMNLGDLEPDILREFSEGGFQW